MNRIVVVAATMLIFAGWISRAAAANQPTQCGKYGDLTACDDSNRSAVNIGGGHSNTAPPSDSADNGTTGESVERNWIRVNRRLMSSTGPENRSRP